MSIPKYRYLAAGCSDGSSILSKVANILAAVFDRPQIWASTKDQDERSIFELIDALLGSSGEVSGTTFAHKILDRYFDMSDVQKQGFFQHLSTELDVDPGTIRKTILDYENKKSKASYRAFMEAAEPKRQELVRRLNQVPGATGRLVAMRKDLLKFQKNDQKLAAVDLDFRHLFASWFNRGFLVLRPISWKSPADVLQKIIQYEAVHQITSWTDLRSRLEPKDRRCFAFFHPAMPDEPLIFVEVALSQGVPNSIQTVLSEKRDVVGPTQADTAVFYSISNCQSGLAGISFGNSLIKQVVADLSSELTTLKTFVTLSPIPGFGKWLKDTNRIELDYSPDDIKRLAALYLLSAKQSDGWPSDPVARFHLGNGALVHAVHANADTSDKGKAQSLCAMVNYLYDLSLISTNHESFASEKKIAASSEAEAVQKAAIKAKL
jgi:malonyl-CoA decarboxylase